VAGAGGRHNWTNKGSLVPELDPTGQCLFTPFGGNHIGPALLVNFGLVGAAWFLAVFSYLLKASRTVNPRGWWLHYYICGLLPFILFRDAFMVLNKALIGSGLLIAIALVWMDRLRILRPFKTARPAAPIAPAP
jgi:hypothetical protein